MKKRKKISVCFLGVFLAILTMSALVCWIINPVVFYELGDDYAEYADGQYIVKIEQRRPNNEHICTCIIPGKVVDYKYNENQIIVHQVYDKLYTDAYFGLSESDTLSINKHTQDSIKAFVERLRKMNNCYWIIFKKKDSIVGPLNKRDFDAKCKKEGISLKFD